MSKTDILKKSSDNIRHIVNTYEKSTLTIFNILGSFLVDLYYNKLYIEAVKRFHEKKIKNITDGYRHSVYCFWSVLDSNNNKGYNPTTYNEFLVQISKYFQDHTSLSIVTVKDCITKVVKELVPEDYYDSLTTELCSKIFRMCISNVIRHLSESVTGEFLVMIIDFHNEESNVRVLQEKVLSLFIDERNNVYNQFLQKNMGVDSNEKIDKSLLERAKEDMLRMHDNNIQTMEENASLVSKNADLTLQLEGRTRQVQQLLEAHKKFKEKEEEYKNVITQMSNEITSLSDQLSQLQQQQQQQQQTNYYSEDYTHTIIKPKITSHDLLESDHGSEYEEDYTLKKTQEDDDTTISNGSKKILTESSKSSMVSSISKQDVKRKTKIDPTPTKIPNIDERISGIKPRKSSRLLSDTGNKVDKVDGFDDF